METTLPATPRFAVEQQVLNLLRKLLEGRAQVNAIRIRRDLQHVNQILRRRARPQSALEQRLRPIGDHLGGIEIITAAETVTLGAGSIGAVKRK